jgi:hypothetical protein
MSFEELKEICTRLNGKFKGKPLPKTDWVVKDFIIMPDENQDQKIYNRVVLAIEMGLAIDEIEGTLQCLKHLEIRLRFIDSELDGLYYPRQFGFAHEDLNI